MTETGAGVLVLTGANTYTGATTVYAGMLQMNSTGALPAASSIVASGGTLDLGGNSFSQTGASISFSGGVVQNGSLVYAGAYTASAGTVSANLGGSAGLIMNGPGLLLLTGANTYTGPTTISGGTLQLGDGSAGDDGSLATSSISNSGAIVYNLNGNQTAAYAISGSGSLTKTGPGARVDRQQRLHRRHDRQRRHVGACCNKWS